MIKIELRGGLGNQMFQYAAARALAEKNSTGVKLDLGWFDAIAGRDTARHFELDCFSFPKHISTNGIVSKIARRKPRWEHLSRKLAGGRVYTEPDHLFHAGFFNVPDHSRIIGFFQSEKYFISAATTIRQDFQWLTPPSGKNKESMKRIENDLSSVSIHVRRGDYVTNKHANVWHGVLDMKYYQAAMTLIAKEVKQPTFYIFSDDPDWCKKNFKSRHPLVFIDHNDGATAGNEDMRLMKSCRHNITANSSMSWWGSWLNQNNTKLVIAPKRWFVEPTMSDRDLVPASWKRL